MMGTMKLYIRNMIRKGGANLKFNKKKIAEKLLFKNAIHKDLITSNICVCNSRHIRRRSCGRIFHIYLEMRSSKERRC